MRTQKEDDLRQQDHPQTTKTEISIPPTAENVKAGNPLRELRVNAGLMAKDMVEVVQQLYPKYDKTLQSKCEKSDEYGVELRADAMKALQDKFAPSLPTAPRAARKDKHRYTTRLTCRLPEEQYRQLQQHIRNDGYATMQSWLLGIINDYLSAKGSTP